MKSNDFREYCKVKYTNSDQSKIYKKTISLLDEYEKNNSFENREYLCYLTAAIFLTYKKMYPQISKYIPFRTKADLSYINNIQKEFSKFMKDADSKDFDTEPIIKDISGIRLVLDNINFKLPPTKESDELFNDPDIVKLLNMSKKNSHFADEVDNYLHSSLKSGKKYFEYKIDLLKKIIEITPEEFSEERMPNPSFVKLLEETTYQYNYFLEYDSFPSTVSDFEIKDLTELLDTFRFRLDDQLHFAVLRKTLPTVLNDPLIKNALKTSFKEVKETKKENGFQAIYYSIDTPFGPVELQAQSNKAYYASTKGSAYHSGMDGKNINVKEYFELVDPNDEHELSYYLDILDSISADSMISPYELPEFNTQEEKEAFLKTSRGAAYLESEKYREMIKHIQIKPKMQISSGAEIDTDSYLLSNALALSPYMNVCSSGHTSFTTAGIHHKKVIGEFAEVLRKKDSNTCLRAILIRRIEHLVDNPDNEEYSDNLKASLKIVKKHDEIATRLPKDISRKNIISYAEKLRDMEKSDSGFEIA